MSYVKAVSASGKSLPFVYDRKEDQSQGNRQTDHNRHLVPHPLSSFLQAKLAPSTICDSFDSPRLVLMGHAEPVTRDRKTAGAAGYGCTATDEYDLTAQRTRSNFHRLSPSVSVCLVCIREHLRSMPLNGRVR